MNVKDTCELFWKLEDEFSLLHKEFDGIKVWQAYRMYFYYEITEKAGILDIAHSEKKSILKRLYRIGSFLKSCIFENPIFSFKKREIIVFDHKRKIKHKNKFLDIYTHFLISDIRGKGQNLEVWEQPYNSEHFTNQESFRYHLDFPLFLSRFLAFFISSSQSNEEIRVAKELEEHIKNEFQIDFNLKNKFDKYIKLAKAQRIVFKFLFKIKSPKKLFIVVAYGQPIIVSVAKNLGIEVIELQHGIISKYHLGYSYPHLKKMNTLDHFPSQIWVWNDFWKTMAPFPIDNSNIQVYPFQHVMSMKDKYKYVQKKMNQILVISQGVIGDNIAGEILKDIDNLEGFNIVFKLHPGEINRWKQYKYLTKLSNYSNVSVNDGSDSNIYKLMAESKIVIGVFSTAIFESLSFGCSAYLLELHGIENMYDFINDGNAVLIQKEKKISDYINIINLDN